jgi:hypothetical protein
VPEVPNVFDNGGIGGAGGLLLSVPGLDGP